MYLCAQKEKYFIWPKYWKPFESQQNWKTWLESQILYGILQTSIIKKLGNTLSMKEL